MRTPFDTPGPKPGPNRAVSQHKAMASGYELPVPKREVDIYQKEHKTGCTYAPGLTSHKSKRGGR